MGKTRDSIIPWALICASCAPCFATEYVTIEQAQRLSFPSAQRFDNAFVVFTDDQKVAIENSSGIPVTTRAQKIWKAFDKDNHLLGWFIVDYVVGKHLLIDYSVAIGVDKKVHDVEILAYRESYGGEVRSRTWLDQFVGKDKEAPILLNHDINNISGATLSSRHVTEGVKRILATIDVTQ